MTKQANISHLINLFFLTNRAFHKHMEEAKVITSFSFIQFITMNFVREEGPVSMKDIAIIFSFTPSSATSLVHGLVQLGYLERIEDNKDRRVIRLRTTALGRKKLSESENKAKKELKSVFLKLNDGDRNDMIRVLEKLSSILTEAKGTSAKRAHGKGASA